MKIKTALTVALLLFVVISIVALIARESGNYPRVSTESEADNNAVDTKMPENRIIVYYFHGNVRCPTCLTLEAYSKEAVETQFQDELKSGRVDWQVINYHETWNEHFLQDYDLSFQSVVLAEIKDGNEVRYTNLEKIWDLVGDKAAYIGYVGEEIRASLKRL